MLLYSFVSKIYYLHLSKKIKLDKGKFSLVIWYISNILDNHQQHSKDVLQELENIDGKADNVGIAFVKINDLELVDEYSLANIPAIVYFRYATPIIYQGIHLNNLLWIWY